MKAALLALALILSSAAFANEVLDDRKVNYITNEAGDLIVLKTKRTASAVEALVEEGVISEAQVVQYAESLEEASLKQLREERRRD